MLNVLRFDFYKLTRSKKLKVFYIIAAAALLIINLINYFTIDRKGTSVLGMMRFSYNVSCGVLIVFFVAFFVGEDFLSGYIKNIYANTNKLYYVLSKIIYIAAFCFALWIWIALVCSLLVYVSGARCFINEEDYRQFVYQGYEKSEAQSAFLQEIFTLFALEFLGFLAMGAITMFLVSFFKSVTITSCVIVAYAFSISPILTNALTAWSGGSVFFAYFLPFGSTQLKMMLLWQFVPFAAIIFPFVSALFTFLTWVVVKYRRV